jgi:hypothetical protein
VPIQEPVENDYIVAKLCQFSQSKGFIRVLVIKKPAIEDVLTYVHDHSLGEDCQVGIVWIKDAHGALHYGLLHKGHLINDNLRLDDGSELTYDAFKYVHPSGKNLIRHISTPYERAVSIVSGKPKLIP